MLDYTNKTVLVTGGASGIGRAATLAFARQGASVHVVELNDSAWSEVQEDVKNLKGKAQIHTCDVSDQKSVVSLFNSIGRVDVLVNNAGVAHVGKVTNTSEADFERLFKVNVKGVYNCMYAAIPLMQQQGGGVILNMSSIAAYVGLSDRFAYSMTKGAVSAMTISAARDYLGDNIRVNSISASLPG